MKKPDIITGLIGVLISIFVFIETSKFPKDIVMGIGPGFFPRILAELLLIASVILIIQAIKRKTEETTEKFDLKDKNIQRSGIVLLVTILYFLLLKPIGFIIGGIIYLFVLMFILKKRNYFMMILIASGVTTGIFLVFKMILHITLPTILL